jgi:5-methylcytosine-specific restriction endonuclease McrA
MAGKNKGTICGGCNKTHFPKRRSPEDAYHRYMNSRCWRIRRLLCFRRARWRCESCGAGCCMLHAHHLTYERLGNEKNEDLQALCMECHERVHRKKDLDRREKALDTFAEKRWGPNWEKFIPRKKVEDTFDRWIESVRKRKKR